MKLVFAGTPEFAAVSLEALLAARHEVTLVLTQPDRPAGRGLKALPSAVKQVALKRGLPVFQPTTLKEPQAQAAIESERPDVMVVAAYGLLLPPLVLTLPGRGCVNVHASLLPRWRGAAPIQRALLAGDTESGITIMQMDRGLDTGPILAQESLAIASDETTGTLHDRLAALGARLLVKTLAANPQPRPQDGAAATYAARINKKEAEIDWRKPAAEIERQVRAFNPLPGAATRLGGIVVKIWSARVEPAITGAAGVVSAAGDDGIVVGCGAGSLRVTEVQRAGGKRIAAQAFLAGFRVPRGARLGADG